MYNFIRLRVKCPICGHSLMDNEVLVDNEPGIKLSVQIPDQKGSIRLSSIYGSHNYVPSFDIPSRTVAEFYCPYCKDRLTGTLSCEQCSAPMVNLHLHEGGKVSFCSRSGCKQHSVEFADLPLALKYFYDRFSYKTASGIDIKVEIKKPPAPSAEQIEREIIETGTFLHAFCPHCKKTLLENDMLKFKIEKDFGEEGFLMLSPYLNVFSHSSTIYLPESKAIQDIKCFHCDTTLMEEDSTCPKCGSTIAAIYVAAMSKLIDFYICSMKGCTWHGLSNEDLEDIMLQDSEEW